jgi:hypothetical protein
LFWRAIGRDLGRSREAKMKLTRDFVLWCEAEGIEVEEEREKSEEQSQDREILSA